VSSKRLMSLVIDPFEDQWGFRGYVADAGDETIVVYSSGNLLTSENLYETLQNYFLFMLIAIQISGLRKWWKLRMLHGPEIPRVHSTDLAISRRNSILYMTGHNTHDLFSINLERLSTDKLLRIRSLRVRAKSSFLLLFTVLSALSTVISNLLFKKIKYEIKENKNTNE